MVKLVAEGTPDVLICGKRAYEYDYGPLPNSEAGRRGKKARRHLNNENGHMNPLASDWLSRSGGNMSSLQVHGAGGSMFGQMPSYHQDYASAPFPSSISSSGGGSFMPRSGHSRMQTLNDQISRMMEQLRIEEQRVMLTRQQLGNMLREWSQNLDPISGSSNVGGSQSALQEQSQLQMRMNLFLQMNGSALNSRFAAPAPSLPIQQGRFGDLNHIQSFFNGSGEGGSGGSYPRSLQQNLMQYPSSSTTGGLPAPESFAFNSSPGHGDKHTTSPASVSSPANRAA